MGRILVLREKGDLPDQLRRDLEGEGHGVMPVRLGDAAEAIHIRNPDMVLVDLTLQGSIVEVWQQLKYDLCDDYIPAMVIIARERIREIELLEEINDFIVYPYDVRELNMRIKLILRRHESVDVGEVIRIGNLVIYPTRYEVTVEGWPVVLTLKEYELLKYLATHRGRVITRETLLDQIWGYNYYGGTRTVDVHVGRLRTKIETGNYSFIRTVRGVGYTFTDEYPSG